jgi:hypothetical protein
MKFILSLMLVVGAMACATTSTNVRQHPSCRVNYQNCLESYADNWHWDKWKAYCQHDLQVCELAGGVRLPPLPPKEK